MNRGDWQRLLHIRTHCRDIRGFVERFGKDQDVFTSDRACFNAVSMAILQIGELANGLSESFREMTKERIPWGVIRGMRNWLAHAYGEMDEGEGKGITDALRKGPDGCFFGAAQPLYRPVPDV